MGLLLLFLLLCMLRLTWLSPFLCAFIRQCVLNPASQQVEGRQCLHNADPQHCSLHAARAAAHVHLGAHCPHPEDAILDSPALQTTSRWPLVLMLASVCLLCHFDVMHS